MYVANLWRIALCLLLVIFVWPTGPRIQAQYWTVDPVHLLDWRCLSAGGKRALAVCSFPCLHKQNAKSRARAFVQTIPKYFVMLSGSFAGISSSVGRQAKNCLCCQSVEQLDCPVTFSKLHLTP